MTHLPVQLRRYLVANTVRGVARSRASASFQTSARR